MVQTSTNDSHQLTTRIDRLRIWPLVVAPVPLLHASFHLSHVIGSQGQTLKTTTSGHGTRGDKVVQGQTIEGSECTHWTLDSLVHRLGQRIGPPRIVAGSSSILDIIAALEPLKAFHTSIVDVLGVGDELRRRRSIGGRHFEWRMG